VFSVSCDSAGIVFYLLYPKYYFINTITRGNKITGKVKVLKIGEWVRSPFGYKNLPITPEDIERWLK
jgi:hypothetical protein